MNSYRRVFPAAFAVVLLLLSASASAAPESAPACPNNPQSPRDVVAAFDGQSTDSIVEVISRDQVNYKPRSELGSQVLFRCGQHYHFPIENHQRCADEFVAGEGPRPARPGDTVEVHTVYASEVNPHRCPTTAEDGKCCDPESLGCCTKGPFVVRAFNAEVTPGGEPEPIEPPPGRPLAEWTGSTTCPDCEQGKCKPEAQWSFRLGCEFTLSEGQLRQFHHPHEARALQTGYRVSSDLTLVTPAAAPDG